MKPLSTEELQQMLDDIKAQSSGTGGAAIASPTSLPLAKPVSVLGQQLSTPSANDIVVLEDALSYVSSDVLRGMGTIIGSDGAPVSDYWFGVILAVRREFGEAGKEPTRRWSQQSERYKDGSGFEAAWNQYKPDHPKPVTIGSVFMLAKAFGWQGTPLAASPCESAWNIDPC